MATQIVVKDLKQAFDQARDLDGSMSERLDVFADAMRKQHPAVGGDRRSPGVAASRARCGDTAPKPGDVMPPFVLPDESGRLVSLKDLLATRPRGRDLPSRTLVPLLPHQHQHAGESAAAHRGARRPHGGDRAGPRAVRRRDEDRFRTSSFPILSDMDNGYAMSLNLAIWVGDEMEEYMTGIGRSLPVYQGNESWMLPIPATFVVGRDGRIKARFVDPDYRKRMAIEELIAALK